MAILRGGGRGRPRIEVVEDWMAGMLRVVGSNVMLRRRGRSSELLDEEGVTVAVPPPPEAL